MKNYSRFSLLILGVFLCLFAAGDAWSADSGDSELVLTSADSLVGCPQDEPPTIAVDPNQATSHVASRVVRRLSDGLPAPQATHIAAVAWTAFRVELDLTLCIGILDTKSLRGPPLA